MDIGGVAVVASQSESTDGSTFTMPNDVVPGSVNVTARAYASPVGNLLQALEALIREPHGCFEQTSATTYPLVMAMQYFKAGGELAAH